MTFSEPLLIWWVPEDGDYRCGYYLGCEESEYGLSDYPPSMLHKIQFKDVIYQFFGSAKIDRLLSQIERGEPVVIGYRGKRQIGKNRQMHDWIVKRGVDEYEI